MRLFTSTTTPEEYVGQYGDRHVRDDEGYSVLVGRRSLLIDHTEMFEAAGGTIRVGKHATWAVLPGGEAVPVVCGDIIRIHTEDGPSDGRCGLNVVGDLGACQGHADERQGWRDMSEAERCQWEKDHDDFPNYI
jgi:hypothetical protein